MYSSVTASSPLSASRAIALPSEPRSSSPCSRKSNGRGGAAPSRWFTTSDSPYRVSRTGSWIGASVTRSDGSSRVVKRTLAEGSSVWTAAISRKFCDVSVPRGDGE